MDIIRYKEGSENNQFAVGCFGIVLFMLSPLWIGQLGIYITKTMLDKPCSESTDCIWLMVPDYVYYTLPMGALSLLFYVPVWLLTNYEIETTEADEQNSIEDSTKDDDL